MCPETSPCARKARLVEAWIKALTIADIIRIFENKYNFTPPRFDRAKRVEKSLELTISKLYFNIWVIFIELLFLKYQRLLN